MRPTWDYTHHAAHYAARPNYADAVIDRLVDRVGARRPGFLALDVGAGTANLSLMLLRRGVGVHAVEPNDEMRRIGMDRTRPWATPWTKASGERTSQRDASFDWVTMGSSFNTMDPTLALAETSRVLRPGGHFSCLWNHRDLDDPFQDEVQRLIRRSIPGYAQGARREDQAAALTTSGLFEDAIYDEASQVHELTPERYVTAWRSTATLRLQAGEAFEEILRQIADLVRAHGPVRTTYTTRAWTARVR